MPGWVPFFAWALLALGGLATYWIDEDALPRGGLLRGWLLAYSALAAAALLVGLQLGGDPGELLLGLLAVGILGTGVLLLFRRFLGDVEDADSEDDESRTRKAP